jgi:tetratricopeptide (TPR) repeat protein
VIAGSEGRCDAAYEWYKRALEVNPRSTVALSNIGVAAACLEMYEEAAEWYAKRRELGASPTLAEVQTYLEEGRFSEARRVAEAFRDDEPADLQAIIAVAMVAVVTRDVETARRLVEQVYRLVPDWGIGAIPSTLRTGFAWILFEEGEAERASQLLDEARAWLDEALIRYGPEADIQQEFAALNALSGNPDEALRWLEEALEASGGRGYRLLRIDPRFDVLSADPRFQGLLERMEADITSQRGRVENGEVDLEIG